MKKIIIISILSLLVVSCAAPYSTYDHTPRYNQYPYTYHHPTKVIVVKHKHVKHNHHKKHKRNVKVRINRKRR